MVAARAPCDIFDPWVRWEFVRHRRRRRLEIWGPGNLGIWRSGYLEIQKCGVQKIKTKKNTVKLSKFKSVLPKMSARSGLVSKSPPGPIWGHLRPFFPWTGKIQKMLIFRLFPLVGQWALFTRFVGCHTRLARLCVNAAATCGAVKYNARALQAGG